MHNGPKPSGVTGTVIVEQPCTGALPYLVTYIALYDKAHRVRSGYQPCGYPQTWKLTPGEYRVLASALAFWPGAEEADVAVQSLAEPFMVRAGQTITVRPKLRKPEQVIAAALRSLNN